MYCMVWWKTHGSEVRLEFTMVSELVLESDPLSVQIRSNYLHDYKVG